MTKSVFRTVNTVGPKELLPIYFLLDNELNRILRDEKEKLEQLIVKEDGKAVAKGEFTKQFNQIFGNTLLGVVDAWYYRILQLNIYDLLLSLHDRKEIQQTLRENDNKINSKLWDMLTEKGLYASRGYVKNIKKQKTDVTIPDKKTFELNFGYGDKQIVKRSGHTFQFKLYQKKEADELGVDQWMTYHMPVPATVKPQFSGIVKNPSFVYNKTLDILVAHVPCVMTCEEVPQTHKNILGVDLGKVKNYSATVLYPDKSYSDEYIPSNQLSQLCNKVTRQSAHILALHELGERVKAYQNEELTARQERREVNEQATRQKRKQTKDEVARLTAKEIVEIAYQENCRAIHVEELHWLESRGGKWNYAATIKYIRMFAELYGIKVIEVDCADSSKMHPYTKEIGVIRDRNVYWYDGSFMDRDRLAGLNIALRGKNNARGKKIPVRSNVKSQRVKRKSSRSVNKELKQAFAVYRIKANEKDKYDTVYLSPQQEGQVYDYGTSLRTHSSAYRQEPTNHFSEKGLLRMPRIKEYADIATLCI